MSPSLTAVKARLVRILLGDMTFAPEGLVRSRREAYEALSIDDLITLIDRSMTAARARSAAMREALRLVASNGRDKR